MIFINDNSTQTGVITNTITPIYSNVTNPSIIFTDLTSGIYNPSSNKLILYTSGTAALTIDSNQLLRV